MNYFGARENDLLYEIELAQLAIRREERRIAEAKKALADLRAGSKDEEHKKEDEPSLSTALT